MKCLPVVHVNEMTHFVHDDGANAVIGNLDKALVQRNHTAGAAATPAPRHATQAELAELHACQAKNGHRLVDHDTEDVFGFASLPAADSKFEALRRQRCRQEQLWDAVRLVQPDRWPPHGAVGAP